MDAFLGTILPWPMDWAPVGWALCDGKLLNINQNQALFMLLGTSFGGDGKTSFGLPDLRGRTILGYGQGTGLTNRGVGDTGGKEAVALTLAMMPAHTHTATFTPSGGGNASGTLLASSKPGTKTDPTGNYIANASTTSQVGPTSITTAIPSYIDPASAGTPAAVAGLTVTGSGGGGGKVEVSPAGGGGAIPTVPPFLALNYIICLSGIFPTRQ